MSLDSEEEEDEDRSQFSGSASKYWAKANLQTMENNKRKKMKEMRWKCPTTIS